MEKRTSVLFRIIVIIVVTVIFILIGVRLYFRVPVRDYYEASEKTFVMPGLLGDYVQQGLDYDMDTDSFFITGYNKNGSATAIFIVDRKSNCCIRETYLFKEPNVFYTGHAGGIAVNGEYVYVTGEYDNCLMVFRKIDILKGTAISIGSFPTKINDDVNIVSDFVCVNEGHIIVGEFYREDSYPTPDSHKLVTSKGDYNQALGLVYSLDTSYEFGINPDICEVLSLPNQVQGMCINGDDVYISTSWGASKSIIERHSYEAAKEKSIFKSGDKEYKLTEFDSHSLRKSKKLAPMSEEIIYLNGKIYTMCESASSKYIFGNFTGGRYCYATDEGFWQ